MLIRFLHTFTGQRQVMRSRAQSMVYYGIEITFFLFYAYGAIAVSTLPVLECSSKHLRIFGRFNLES